MPERRVISGSRYEDEIGYSRAVVEDGWVFVSGTTGVDYPTGRIPPSIEEQVELCLANVEAALREAGCGFSHVVRVLYVLPDRGDFGACWPALRRAFGEAKPAATMIQAGLIDPRMKIEIQVTARLPRFGGA